jgi:hypothetical protein
MSTIAGFRYTYDEAADTTPRPSRTLELRPYLGLVDQLAAAGLPPPAEFAQLRERLGELQTAVSDGRTQTAQLIAAVLHGGADIKAAYAMALAEYTPAAEDVLTPTYAAALAELQRIYGPSARAHYRVLRDRFDKAAKAFASCAKLIDPASGADAVIGDGHALQAWKDAGTYADRLDELVEVVAAAAELVRGPAEPAGLGVSRVPFLLPLFVDLDGVHRREAWAAWEDQPMPTIGPLTTPALQPPAKSEPTRGGRWTRLHRIGAPIRCVDDPVGMDLYGAPQPMGVKQVTQPAGAADNPRRPEWVRFDPEDEATPPRRPLARLRASLARRQPEPTDLLDTVLTSEGDDQHDD